MRFWNPIKISYKNLMTTKNRSFLTILGIIIGVSSVIIIFSIGLSAQKLVLDQVEGIGSNLIAITPGASEESGPPASVMGISVTTLTYDDLRAIKQKRNVPEIEYAAGYVLGTASVLWKNNNLNTSFSGVTADYIQVENAEIENGRFFTKEEERNLSRVVVLGNKIARDLFNNTNPLNKKVEIKGQKYTIIGVFKERGSLGFGVSNQDNSVFIPLFTAQKLIMGINHLGFIRAKVVSTNLIESGKNNIFKILRERHNIDNPANDDFSVRDLASAITVLENITDALRYFMLSVGSISLLVGGVGVMNIMLIAVNQRIWEIGLRKALGAKIADIFSQFILETLAVVWLGGILGIILGILVSFLISVIAGILGYEWKFLISFWSIIVAVAISVIIGILFGLYPAYKASRISPMEALRYE